MRQLAKRRLPGPIFHYIDGAADDEVTYRRNTAAFEECGFAKTDPRIYRGTARRGGSAPGEAVHVGNSLINDVQGAQGAGIRAIWSNRRGIANDTTIQPDAAISNRHQLPDLIG